MQEFSSKRKGERMETKNVLIRFPFKILEEVDHYKEKEGIKTRTSAVLELIRLGLNQVNNKESGERK